MGNPLSGGWGPQLTLGMCWKGQLLRPQGRAAAALTWQGWLPPREEDALLETEGFGSRGVSFAQAHRTKLKRVCLSFLICKMGTLTVPTKVSEWM